MLFKKLSQILESKNITFQKMCSDLHFKEVDIEKRIKANTLMSIEAIQIVKYLEIQANDLSENEHDKILLRMKDLLRLKNIPFSEMCKDLGLSNSSLYKSFSNQTLSLKTLINISNYLEVSYTYFFENDIIERLTEEVAKHPQNPDLKSFLMGFSRDVNKGMDIERAAHKNVNPSGYNIGLLI